jgi:hypothetical protein
MSYVVPVWSSFPNDTTALNINIIAVKFSILPAPQENKLGSELPKSLTPKELLIDLSRSWFKSSILVLFPYES